MRSIKWKCDQMLFPCSSGVFHLYMIEGLIYIYAFSRRFYPKRLTGYTCFYQYVFPGNRTHNLCAANTMLYRWATEAYTDILYIDILSCACSEEMVVCFYSTSTHTHRTLEKVNADRLVYQFSLKTSLGRKASVSRARWPRVINLILMILSFHSNNNSPLLFDRWFMPLILWWQK